VGITLQNSFSESVVKIWDFLQSCFTVSWMKFKTQSATLLFGITSIYSK